MTNLLISKQTKLSIDRFAAKPSHGLLISGPAGSGKTAVALELGAQLLGLSAPEQLANYPYFHHLVTPPDKKEIPIELVRELIRQLKLKTLGASTVRRIVLVENAELLSHEAQNSLLKSLEEAPDDTVFLLSAPAKNYLLPTIASRLQELAVQPVSLAEATEYLQAAHAETEIKSAWQLSAGSASLLVALLSTGHEHPLKKAVASFKQFLNEDRGFRLVRLDALEKDKLELGNFLDAGGRILNVLHQEAVKKQSEPQANRFLVARRQVLEAQQLLQANTMPRLILLDLILNLAV